MDDIGSNFTKDLSSKWQVSLGKRLTQNIYYFPGYQWDKI